MCQSGFGSQTSALPIGLLDLPGELLIDILTLADDVGLLPAVALTCKTLYESVYGEDESLWRQLHNLNYDNPIYACAFLQPRTGYKWRHRVKERYLVARFLKDDNGVARDWNLDSLKLRLNGIPPGRRREPMTRREFRYLSQIMDHWLPRIQEVILDMYLDLPSSSAPSANVALLEQMMSTHMFHSAMLLTIPQLKCDNVTSEASHPWAHFAAVVTAQWGITPEINDFALPTRYDWTRPLGEQVNWDMVMRSARLWSGNTGETRSLALREPGLLGLLGARQETDGVVWDWAEVGGSWKAYMGWRCHARPVPRVISPIMLHLAPPLFHDVKGNDRGTGYPVGFDLVAVGSRAEVDVAYACQRGSDSAVDLWDNIPADSKEGGLLPTLYFYSTRTTDDYDQSCPSGQDSFVYGMVGLSSDSPPELKWVFAVERISRPREGMVAGCVQLGGRIYGQYAQRLWGPRNQLASSLERDSATVRAPPADFFHASGHVMFRKAAPGEQDQEEEDSLTVSDLSDPVERARTMWALNAEIPISEQLCRNWICGQVDDDEWGSEYYRSDSNSVEYELPSSGSSDSEGD